MADRSFFFAAGGTGGHIYPAIAVAEKIIELSPETKIHFFCSRRNVDSAILSKTNFEITKLPAENFSLNPKKILSFCKAFLESVKIAKQTISQSNNAIVIGFGGFVSVPACWSAYRLKRPTKLVNTDIVPGRANKILARIADEIFVQFEDTVKYFPKTKVTVTGCPLRKEFEKADAEKIKNKLALNKNKKILLITGASSGAVSINEAVCELLDKLNLFADSWQIVHLTGHHNFEDVKRKYANAEIEHTILDYCDDMANLLSAADLVIGRSGAVSVAEYAASSCAVICMPYPHHKDKQQYLNAAKLVEVGAAVIVDDLADINDRAGWLWEELAELMSDETKREQMKKANRKSFSLGASEKIAKILLNI